MELQGALILADGTVFTGKMTGAVNSPVCAETVFNTSMIGYQEVLTDPAYAGQLVVMTYPLIGNYGVELSLSESSRVQARALVTRELWDQAELRGGRRHLSSYLAEAGVVVLTDVDTRALTRHLRQQGSMKGVIAPLNRYSVSELQKLLAESPDYDKVNHLPEITCTTATYYGSQHPIGHLALVDLGYKKSTLEALLLRGYSVTVLPPTCSPQDVYALNVDGVLFSSGPGNPEVLTDQIMLAKALIGKMPLFGICLGHQILALALGAKTYKLKFGHRGVNHPVRYLATGQIHITVQNHGYAVSETSLEEAGLVVTHRNLNDGTVEGLSHQYLPVSGVQFLPEPSPNPLDAAKLFDQFVAQLPQAKAC